MTTYNPFDDNNKEYKRGYRDGYRDGQKDRPNNYPTYNYCKICGIDLNKATLYCCMNNRCPSKIIYGVW